MKIIRPLVSAVFALTSILFGCDEPDPITPPPYGSFSACDDPCEEDDECINWCGDDYYCDTDEDCIPGQDCYCVSDD